MAASLLSRTTRRPLVTEGIVLPFLYRTTTILRCYSENSEATAEYAPKYLERDETRSLKPRSAARPRPETNDRLPRTRGERPTRTPQERPIRTRKEETIQAPGDVNSSRRRPTTTRGRGRVTDVPFEGPVPSNDPNVRLQGSTMTPKELAIFENLFRSKQAKPTDSKKPGVQKEKATNSAKVVPDFPAPLRALADEAQLLHARATPEVQDDGMTGKSSLHTSEAAEKFFTKIKARMDKASTDVALWQIMTDEVFGSIRALKLDGPSARSAMKAENVEALASSLPSILLHFMSLMHSTFPGSSYGLALLPTLKQLGPSASALGATTDLYNEHMQMLYRQYTDLDSIAETLTEMDKEVYEFNTGTSSLLQAIFQCERAATSGRMGPAMQALWSTDRKVRALQKLKRWDQTVQERLRNAAIRKLRAKDYSLKEIAEEGEELEATGESHSHVAAI